MCEPHAIDVTLRTLEAAGFSRLAKSVITSKTHEGSLEILSSGGENSYQRQFACGSNSQLRAQVITEWPVTIDISEDGRQLSVEFIIKTAPKSFLFPVLAKQAWTPPFEIKLTCQSNFTDTINPSVQAYVVDEEEIQKMEEWTPVAKSVLTNSSISKTIELKANTSVETIYTFANMAFSKPSKLQPQWIVFSLEIPNSTAHIYTQFMFPTIAMSRASEQLEKSTRILFIKPLVDFRSAAAIDYLEDELNRSLNLRRRLTERCLRTLADNATLLGNDDGQPPTTYQRIHNCLFTTSYLSSTKRLLKAIQAQWERVNPTVICPCWLQRDQAEGMLRQFPAGSFVIRFGSEGGTLVMSTLLPNLSIEHMKISLECLRQSSLEIISSENSNALMLLDVIEQKLYSKQVILGRGYVAAMTVEKATQHHRAPKRMLVSEPSAPVTYGAPFYVHYPPAAAAAAMEFRQQNQQSPSPAGGGLSTPPAASLDSITRNNNELPPPYGAYFPHPHSIPLYGAYPNASQMPPVEATLSGGGAVPAPSWMSPLTGTATQQQQQQGIAPEQSCSMGAPETTEGKDLAGLEFLTDGEFDFDNAKFDAME